MTSQMTPERLDQLEIPLMVSQNSSKFDTAFCVPIEARDRTSTGISAADRAATVLTAIDPATKPVDRDALNEKRKRERQARKKNRKRR